MKKCNLQILSVLLISALFPIVSLAKSVNLYDQANTTSKVVGTIDSSNELIPIITNQAGDWMKVGDPKNGNVGWIKVSDMGSNNGMGVSFSQRTISTSTGPKTIQSIRFETPKTMSPAESQAVFKQMEQRQLEMQKTTNLMIQHAYDEMNSFYKQNPHLLEIGSMPMIVPVIVMPVDASKSNSTKPSQPAVKAK